MESGYRLAPLSNVVTCNNELALAINTHTQHKICLTKHHHAQPRKGIHWLTDHSPVTEVADPALTLL